MTQPKDSTQDWPLDLVRSDARETLAQAIHVAQAKWRRMRPDWRGIHRDERENLRALALRILEGGI